MPDTVELHFDAAEIELEPRRHPLDALDHASGDGCEKQFGGIEGIRSSRHGRIEYDLGVLGSGQTSLGIDAPGSDVIRQWTHPL
jgi:hypothetical protein